MKEYKLVYLNKGIKMSREKDLEQAQDTINEYVADGWELQQITSPSDAFGAMVGVFYKEKQYGRGCMKKTIRENINTAYSLRDCN